MTTTATSNLYNKARKAQLAWSAKPLEERIATIARFRDLLVDRAEELAQLLTKEMGKPISQSRNELKAMPERIDFFLHHVTAAMKQEPLPSRGGCREEIHYEPLGVIGNISAWNYPYFVSSNIFVPALLTGNALFFKPSEYVLETGKATAELLYEAGVPKECFTLFLGGPEAGEQLLESPIDALFFTGSHKTGQAIAKKLASSLIPLQFELGGKDPVYVKAPAVAAAIADGVFYNAGQSCCAIERIYVHESFYDSFLEEFLEETSKLSLADPFLESTTLGPLTRKEQLDFLDHQVADARAKGAKLLAGGKRAEIEGNFYEPTVLTNVDHTMSIMKEESFGPIIGIQKVSSDEEAIALMNDTDYGLTASVYSDGDASELLAQLDAGTVYHNCCDRISPQLPWSGRRSSGLGSTLGDVGIRAFLQPKAWHLRVIEEDQE